MDRFKFDIILLFLMIFLILQMKKIIPLFFVLLVSTYAMAQNTYPLGEMEHTQEREHATVFTTFSEKDYPNLGDSIDLSFMLPPAGDQGAKGSCWAWATTYTLRSTMDKPGSYLVDGKMDYKKVYSPEYVYQYYKGNEDNCQYGAVSSVMLDKILKDGVIRYSEYLYNDSVCNIPISPSLIEKSRQFVKEGYNVNILNDLFSIKKILSENQPLILSIKVDDYFSTIGNITSSNPFWKTFHTRRGSHAMVIVGYNDRLKALKVLNSWGTKFGDNGYVWISYSIINSAMNYACYPKKAIENLPKTTTSLIETSAADVLNDSSDSLASWFKEGYYRPFGELKVVLAKLSPVKDFAVVEIRDSDYNLKTNFYIDEKSSKEFYIEGLKYKFTLDNISRAGRNPLKKAAFFTISEEK